MGDILKLWREACPGHKEVNQSFVLKQMGEMADIFSPGASYLYVFSPFHKKIDWVHPNVEKVLGIAPEDFTLTTYVERVHPEDARPMRLKEEVTTRFFLKEIPPEEMPYYKISYLNRVRTTWGAYKTLLHQAVPLTVTDDSRIGYMLIAHTDMSCLPVHLDHKISFISLKGACSWYRLDPETADFSGDDFLKVLSERERQVLLMISEGKKSAEIANHLNLSVETVSTHRKNILSKTTCKNTTELIARCIRSGLL